MDLSGCGICMYGLVDKKNPKCDSVKCMLNNYEVKELTEKCGQYKRDFRKSFSEITTKKKEK